MREQRTGTGVKGYSGKDSGRPKGPIPYGGYHMPGIGAGEYGATGNSQPKDHRHEYYPHSAKHIQCPDN